MKTMMLMKSMFIAGAFGAALAASAAYAQVSAHVSGAATVAAESSWTTHDEPRATSRAQQGVVMRGGYNIGRTSTPNVPGCQGPVSFCNMYFGN